MTISHSLHLLCLFSSFLPHFTRSFWDGSDSTPAFLMPKDVSGFFISSVLLSVNKTLCFLPKFLSLMSQQMTFILTINLIIVLLQSFPRTSSASDMTLWSSPVLMMPHILVIPMDLINTIINSAICVCLCVCMPVNV